MPAQLERQLPGPSNRKEEGNGKCRSLSMNAEYPVVWELAGEADGLYDEAMTWLA